MKWKEKHKRRKLRATDEIRQRYQAKPIIALYRDEADAILDSVLDGDDLDGFYGWLDEWKKFIFRESNLIVKSRSSKGNSVYLAYKVVGGKFTFTVFSDESDDSVDVYVDPANIDVEEMCAGISSFDEHGNCTQTIALPVSKQYVDVAFPTFNAEVDANKKKIDEIKEHLAMVEKSGLETPLHELERMLSDPAKTDSEKRAIANSHMSLARDLSARAKVMYNLAQTNVELGEKAIQDIFEQGISRVAIMVLAALYHFQKRPPKVYEAGNETHTEGYRKHNDLYNPVKRLNPPAIVRPRNGTRSWFEQQRAKHTESWHVKGHSRTLKAARYKEKRGQTIWVNPFVKGSGENIRLSIYVDQIAGKEMVEVENA